MYATWARVLGHEYQKLAAEVQAGYPTWIDQYGSTNPAEFFAVITEHFFERPQPFRERYPELYKTLQAFYQQDPAGATVTAE
jgi:MtfA peptidase